jgi:glycosyltransferase involved in cell wall biosynthesis
MSYARIVGNILSSISGSHYHIGFLPNDWLDEIRRNIAEIGISTDRFIYFGNVPSLWDTLKGIDAAIYIASAPIGGGRAAIEAQGCGYPVVYYKSTEVSLFRDVVDIYAVKEAYWTLPSELSSYLNSPYETLMQYSIMSREYYERNYSLDAFGRALSRILTD